MRLSEKRYWIIGVYGYKAIGFQGLACISR